MQRKLNIEAGYKSWNVYVKAPFGSAAAVIEYLGRYTHKIAITKHRILSITLHSVTFKYKDYADSNRKKTMLLNIAEFLCCFNLYFLPKRFVKIRHYVFLQNHGKTAMLNAATKQLKLPLLAPKINIGAARRLLEKYDTGLTLCPK